jgi:hypothetical protein
MMKHRRIKRYSSLVAALFAVVLLAAPDGARAAPQMLGLVATKQATPLRCNDGICVGFFSTFCLEEDRLPPASWTAYRPVEGSQITLIVETGDGRTARLPAQDYATFKTRLDFTSILASVALSRLAKFKPVRVSIAIGPLVSLMPESLDANPRAPELLATITGPYRRTGGFFFDDGRGRSGAVAMVTRMINLMPRRGRLPKAERRIAYIETRGAGAKRQDDMRFEAIVNGCETMLARTASRANMRECLENRHAIMQTKTNKEFWKALGGV